MHHTVTDIAGMKRFTQSGNLLIERAAIHANDDRNVQAVLSFAFEDHMPNHFQHRFTMIGMRVTVPENRIDNETPTVHLQGLEPFLLYVGGVNAMPIRVSILPA